MVMITYIIAITIHEFMHAWTALQLGDDTAYHLGRVSLNPVVHFDPLGFFMFLLIAVTGFGFAWGRPVPVNTYRLRPLGRFGKHGSMAVVALAGPASNVVLAIAGALSLRFGGAAVQETPLAQGLQTFVALNVALAAFNMIPVPPLDGSRLLAALVPDFWRPALANLERFSFGILLLLIFLAPTVITAMVMPVYNLIFRMLTAI
ncbi:MAG: site-2 protease family protein [Thermomicrobiales bacterium]|nr:site-2 protease family protein [Thermomicrobiales bacterium]